MVKRRIILKRKVDYSEANEVEKKEKGILTMDRFNEFSYAYNPIKGTNQESGFIREWYEKVFDEFPPWDKHPLEMIVLKIQYEILKTDYDNSGLSLPGKVRQNYEASKNFNLGGLTKGLRNIMKIMLNKNEKGGSTMGKNPKKKGKQQVSVGVAQFLHDLLAHNYRAKLNDTHLASKLKKTFPGRINYDESYIAKHRSLFNSGKFPAQKGKKPKVKLQQYGKAVVAKAKTKPAPKAKPKAKLRKKIILRRR